MSTTSPPGQRNTGQLLAAWLAGYCASLPPGKGLLRVRGAEPRFQTHNFFSRFKVEFAKFDGTGQNPAEIDCVVIEVSVTDQEAKVVSTTCESIKDL